MGTLIKFELKKILSNRAGMVSCALVLAMLAALTVLDYTSSETRDFFTGEVVHGAEAQRSSQALQKTHAGQLTDERVVADAATLDRANQLGDQEPGLFELDNQQIIDTYGLEFWQQTRAVQEDDYYMEVVGTLDSASPRANSLRDGAKARIEGMLDHGFWGHFDYSDAEKAYWRSHADGISWPLTWGYAQGWHDVLQWKGFSGLAVIAICIALSGVFAGEYRDRTAAVVLPTRQGKRALPMAKVAASLIFTTAYWLLLAAIVIGARVVLYGADGWDLPLQVSQGLDVPYPLTIGQAVILSYALGYLMALGMSAFALLISSKVRSTMPVAAITMAFVFMGVLGLFLTPAAKVALLTPFTGLSYVYDYMVSYTAGPIVADLPTVLAFLYAAMLVALTPLAIRAFRKHQVA
ncbi:MAG: ABC transporter permease [Atopobiaceae bacterium]|nr:ABC transporter permease [Atopobiaceae bacterium]